MFLTHLKDIICLLARLSLLVAGRTGVGQSAALDGGAGRGEEQRDARGTAVSRCRRGAAVIVLRGDRYKMRRETDLMCLGEVTLVSGGTRAGCALLRLAVHQVGAALVADVVRLLVLLLLFLLFLGVRLPLAKCRDGGQLVIVVDDGLAAEVSSTADVFLGGLTELATVAARAGAGAAGAAESDTLRLAVHVRGLKRLRYDEGDWGIPGQEWGRWSRAERIS